MCSKLSYGRIYSALIASSLVLISGLSRKTMFNKELWTSSFPLYSIKPNLRNLFMKKLTRDRVVPIHDYLPLSVLKLVRICC